MDLNAIQEKLHKDKNKIKLEKDPVKSNTNNMEYSKSNFEEVKIEGNFKKSNHAFEGEVLINDCFIAL